MNGKKQLAEEDYRQLEYGLEQAQKQLKDVLSSIQSADVTTGISNQVPLSTIQMNGQQDDEEEEALKQLKDVLSSLQSSEVKTGISNQVPLSTIQMNGQQDEEEEEEALDFESIFGQNGFLDFTKKGFSAPAVGDTPALHSATYPLVEQRPDRPMTLSRPGGQLPSCCNFKRQHWRLYVQGEFSYSSLPRHFKDADREINATYKDDLESIIRDLSGKDRELELARPQKSSELKGLNQTKESSLVSKQQTVAGKDSNEDSGKFHEENTEVLSVNSGICESEKDFKSRSGDSVKSGVNCDCAQLPNNSEKQSVSDQNKHLMEDINKNCENIKSQLAILESVSEMIDRAQTKLTAENKCKQNGKNDDLDSNPLHLAGNITSAPTDPPTKALPMNQVPLVINKTDIALQFPTFETPPPPPAESMKLSELSCSSFSTSCKKLKSRKSRNRSLQRCSEERLSAAERRSRTLSPSITERLDYRVSRATQTLDGSSRNSNAVPQTDMEIQSETCSSNAMEVQIGKTVTSQQFSGSIPTKPLETNSIGSGGQGLPSLSASKKESRKGTPTLSMLSRKIFLSSESQTKKSLDVSKSSTATILQNGKTSVKNTVSFAASTKSEIMEERGNSCDHTDQKPAETSETETVAKHSETLLDRMHKKLYPYQYNKQNRTRSTEALSQSAKNGLNQQNGSPRPATLPQTKPTSLTASMKAHNCPTNPNLDKSAQTKPLESVVQDEPASDVVVPGIKTAINEDLRSVEVTSPSSSGYSEISPSSLKETATSPLSSSSKRLRFARALSPEQSMTSCSTPSPPDGKMSMTVGANGSSLPVKDEQAAGANKNSKDIIQLQVSEKKLTDVCEWLISAGFPQYVQLYREGNFPVALTAVESDHQFLDQHCLLILLQRITLLNKLTSMKIRLPLTSCTRDWYTGEMLFAVSPLWDYDPVYHWWQHSDKRFIAHAMKSKTTLPSKNGLLALALPKSDETLKDNLEVDGCTSPPTETTDEASVHLTSGYESETSPISTASLGRQKTLPQSNLRSSSQSTASRSDETCDANSAVRNCDGNAMAAAESHESSCHSVFLGSSQETLKGGFSSAGHPHNRLDSGLPENIPCNHSRVASSNCDDRNMDCKNSEEVDRLLPRRTSSCSASVSSVLNRTSDVRPVCNHSVAAVRGSRKSFYDNALAGDPQTELDLILKELYINIDNLDETLSNLGDGEDVCDNKDGYANKEGYSNEDSNGKKNKEDGYGNKDGCGNEDSNGKKHNEHGHGDENCFGHEDKEDGYGDEGGQLELSDDLECSVGGFPSRNAEEDSDGNRTDACNESVRETEFYELDGSQYSSHAFPSKKAFLSIEDLVRLRKLSILKLTSIFETHCPSSCDVDIVSPLRFPAPEPVQADPETGPKKIFGVPPVVLLCRMGVPLPPTITLAMEHLKSFACDSVGLFRKPGVQSRIQQLQNEMELDPAFHKFDSVDAYDLADGLKRYFREVPNSLLTPQASQLLMTIFTGVPSELHLEAVQSVMLLLSDVTRQVLHVLLRFLAAVADRSEENQMNASNLAVCFLPSFFRTHPSTTFVGDLKPGNQTDVGTSPAWDHKVAVACITFLINNSSSIFQIPEFSWTMLQASISAPEKTSSNVETGIDFRSIDIPSFVQTALDTCHLKDSEWVCQASWFEQTKLSWRLMNDNLLLPMWRCTTEIEAPPGEVLSRLKGEQHLWDCSLIKGRIAERLNERTEVVHYVLHIDSHEAPREFCELRTWKADRDRGSYILAKTSVIHSNVPRTETLRAITFASHYLIEPCGAGRSRVTHISRVDIRGHLIDWYNNVYGRLLERHLHKLNKAFTPVTVNAVGPETKL